MDVSYGSIKLRTFKTPGLLALLQSCCYFERKGRPKSCRVMSVPGRIMALGHPRLLLGRVPGVTEGQRVPVGSILMGEAMVWIAMGSAVVPFFC